MSANSDKKAPRLRFIDMARAVAILLMLEGHFVHLTLGEEYRIRGVFIHDIWQHMRGLAAPMFFTVTGLIFAYLLCGTPANEPYFKSRRAQRGAIRVAELMFWGYALQFHPALLTGTMKIHSESWLIAFHVLQCIACGLIAMICIFGLLRGFGIRILLPAFLLCGFSLFLLDQILQNLQGYWPASAPAIIQNFVKGPTSHFSIAPWLGFTLYGAAIGTWVRHHEQSTGCMIHPAPLLIIGFILSRIGWPMDNHIACGFLDLIGYEAANRETSFYFHSRFGEALLLIGLLACFDKWVKLETTWFEKIGRNTFSIYVVHVIVLYGGLFGIGINDLWTRSLNPWQAALGALLFMVAFGLMAQCIDPLRDWLKSKWPTCLGGRRPQ